MTPLALCPACRTDGSEVSYRYRSDLGDEFDVRLCRGCRHRFLDPMPSFADLAPYYGAGYNCYQPDSDRSSNRPGENTSAGMLRHFSIEAGTRVLDFGCGAGDFLSAARELGADCFGIEPGSEAVAAARSGGIDVFHGTLDDYLALGEGRRFDLITANHVLEHVEDPVATLRELGGLLTPAGRLWVSVPNAESWGSRLLGPRWHSADLPRHVHHFSTSSLTRCFEQAGLGLAQLSTASLGISTANSIKRLLRVRLFVPYRLSSAIGVVDRWLAPAVAAQTDRRCCGEAILAMGGRGC